jgi:galactokinase
VPAESARAFAPGRANLIGEHTDYNGGLALPFAIVEGVRVEAQVTAGGAGGEVRIEALALELGESDEFSLPSPGRAPGWRAFVRGVAAELGAAGWRLPSARLLISGDVPLGAGLSSSAALEVALCLALMELAARGGDLEEPAAAPDRIALARLCARVENEWAGAHTGLLDQLASLCGEPDACVLIDFLTLQIEPVPLVLDGWRLAVLDSGELHSNASSGYNQRRAECARACELLGVSYLREADPAAVAALPQPLRARATHVLEECGRVRASVLDLRAGDLAAVGRLLDQSHASLRDLYEVSTPALERAVARLKAAGAAGARLMGGGFGGSALGLFPPGATPPAGATEVRPSAGAHLIGPAV